MRRRRAHDESWVRLLARALHRVAAAVALAILVGAGCVAPEDLAERTREEIRDSLARGDRATALRGIEDLSRALPEGPEALLETAALRVRAGDAPGAAWQLEDAVRRHPEHDGLRLALGQTALLVGNAILAEETLREIAPESDSHARALVTLAQAALQQGDLERALALLADAQSRYPHHPEARLVEIATLLSEGRPDEARSALEAARAALAGDDPEAHTLVRRLDVTLAQLRGQRGESNAAIHELRRLIDADPDDLLAWQALIPLKMSLDQGEEARRELETAIAARETLRPLLPLLARLQTALGDSRAAESTLRRHAEASADAAASVAWIEHLAAGDDAGATVAAIERTVARFPDDARVRLLRCEALLATGNVADAKAEIERFRAITFEDDPQVAYLEARLVLANGDAADAAERLTRLAPRLDRANVQLWLGRALEATGDTEGAQRRYALAEQRDPRWTAPSAALAAIAEARGQWRALAAHAQQLVRRDPGRIRHWSLLVEGLERLGEGAAAEEAARACLARFPDLAEPHRLLGRALRLQRRFDAALEAFDAAERAQDGVPLPADRALTQGLAGHLAEAIALAARAIEQTPDSAELHATLALLHFASGESELGGAATDRALALDPATPQPLRLRCQFRAATHDAAGARDDCTRYLAARPEDAGAHFMLGAVQAALGERDAAVASYRRAAALDERDAASRNNLAQLLADADDLEGALVVAQEAHRLDETSPQILDTLGMLYLRKGLTERAVSLLEAAHAAAPDLPAARRHLADAYRAAGRLDEARALSAEGPAS